MIAGIGPSGHRVAREAATLPARTFVVEQGIACERARPAADDIALPEWDIDPCRDDSGRSMELGIGCARDAQHRSPIGWPDARSSPDGAPFDE